jgi:hypothetical protein
MASPCGIASSIDSSGSRPATLTCALTVKVALVPAPPTPMYNVSPSFTSTYATGRLPIAAMLFTTVLGVVPVGLSTTVERYNSGAPDNTVSTTLAVPFSLACRV